MTVSTHPESDTMSKEEVERIKAVKLPTFIPPYPSKINENFDTEKVADQAYVWMAELCMKTSKAYEACVDAKIPELPMRVYIEADEERGLWISKFFLWMFTLDDHIDNVDNFSCPEKSTSLLLELNVLLMWSYPDSVQLRENYEAFLNGGDAAERHASLEYLNEKVALARLHPGTVYDTSSPKFVPLCKSFRNLWIELGEAMPDDFMVRWALKFQKYIISNVQETRNRQNNVIPRVEEYIALRRDTVAMDPCMVIVEFLDRVNVPDEVFDCPEMQLVLLAANDIVSWINDFYSFKKELLAGEVHNLVFIVSHERGCSYEEAAKIVFQMVLDKVVILDKAMEDLERVTPPKYKDAVARYIETAKYFVSGNNDWGFMSKRYIVQ